MDAAAATATPTIVRGANWATDGNFSPVVSVVSWVLVVTTTFCVLTRLATRYAVLRTIYIDDYTITLALIFYIGQTVATSVQAATGTGKRLATLSASHISEFEKSSYAADLCYVTSIAFVKISVALYLFAITPVRTHRFVALSIGGLAILWSLASIFVIAFQCALPRPWAYLTSQCIDLISFWTFYDVFNIVSDMCLIILPYFILEPLQMRLTRKLLVLSCFAIRIIVVGAITMQLYFLRHDLSSSTSMIDHTYDLWRTSLATQIVIATSIITACAPYLKPFLEALDTGMLAAENVSRSMGYSFPLEYPVGSTLLSRSNMGRNAQGASRRRHSHLRNLPAVLEDEKQTDAEAQGSRGSSTKEKFLQSRKKGKLSSSGASSAQTDAESHQLDSLPTDATRLISPSVYSARRSHEQSRPVDPQPITPQPEPANESGAASAQGKSAATARFRHEKITDPALEEFGTSTIPAPASAIISPSQTSNDHAHTTTPAEIAAVSAAKTTAVTPQPGLAL